MLNSKSIINKENQKLKEKFFKSFQISHFVEKQDYKLKLSKNWKIYNTFYLLLLERDTIRKEQLNENIIQGNFELNNSKRYKEKII